MSDEVTYHCPNCGWEDPVPLPPKALVTCPECVEPDGHEGDWPAYIAHLMAPKPKES